MIHFTTSFNNGMWCLYQVNAPQAWDISTGDANVVAVTDNTIQINHPDLVNKLVPGRDVVEMTTTPLLVGVMTVFMARTCQEQWVLKPITIGSCIDWFQY